MIKHITRKTAIASFISLILASSAYADVPHAFSAGQPASAASVNENFSNLDGRVSALEAVDPVTVAVDCGADANALKNLTITKDTTYNISGACNGPIYVEKDNVHLLGTSNTTDSIVLAAGIEDSAVWAGGAYNLQITNLFLDLTATTTENYTAGIWARSAFVQVTDSRIEGGGTGINPFRGAIVRLNGTNSITEFANSGLRASDQSNINTRGPVILSSTRTEDQYMKAVAVSRGANIDIRSGITVSVPTTTDARAIDAESNALVLIRNSGTVSLTGDIRGDSGGNIKIEKGVITGEIKLNRSSSLRLDNGVAITGDVDTNDGSNVLMIGGSITGDIEANRLAVFKMNGGSIIGTLRVTRGSSAYLEDVAQTSDDNRAIRLGASAIFTSYNSSLGRLQAEKYATFDISSEDGGASSVNGAELNLGAIGNINGTEVTGDIAVFPPAKVFLFNGTDLNGNNLYACDSGSDADDAVISTVGNSDPSDCRP